MMLARPFDTLGSNDQAWLKARLHFAIAGLGKPEHRALGVLRVWNHDEMAPRTGFPLHSHKNVEIVTYVWEGAITHRDSLGNTGRIEAGQLQAMSAGTGIRHAEFNAEAVATKMFQIWFEPRSPGGAPRWHTLSVAGRQAERQFRVLASGVDASADVLWINADARVLGVSLHPGEKVVHELRRVQYGYLVPIGGRIRINGQMFDAFGGVALIGESGLEIEALDKVELVMVEACW